MRQVLFSLAFLCLFALTAPLDSLGQSKKDKKDYPKDFELLDDFEDGDLLPKGQGRWFGIDDKGDGGSTRQKVESVPRFGPQDKEKGSDAKTDESGERKEEGRCIEMRYILGKRFKKKGKPENPRAYLALSCGGEALKGWRDLTAFQGLTFEFQGEGDFLVILFTKKKDGTSIHFHSLKGGEEWQRYTFPFEDFVPLETLWTEVPDPSAYPLNLQQCTLIAIGTGLKGKPFETGIIRLDDFGFIKKSKSDRKKELNETEEIVYGDLVIRKPKKYWTWEKGKELKNEGKAISMHFAAFPMVNDWRVPFPGGRFADPANVKQMEQCTLFELNRHGLRNLRRTSHKKVALSQFRSHRFVFTGTVTPAMEREFKKVGLTSPAIFVQVDFIKYRSVMYEVLTIAHQSSVKENLHTINWIIKNLKKWKKGR